LADRYLEDRKIIDKNYFENIASRNSKWNILLNSSTNKPDLDPSMEGLLYPRVLEDKDFTYDLFEQLSEDFNGDMFPSDPEEKIAVEIAHLKILQGFLRGEVGEQKNIFFLAYKFDVIPIELISSIYEEFYLTSTNDDNGTRYTPSSLVRFVLAKVLTPECLDKNPRILDPYCGSGIFLVEAFRRIVSYRVYKKMVKH
jgi:type I restriction-modification system DNA methylase subunit